MASETSLIILTPSASRARVLPGLLKLPPEIKIETITATETWRPKTNQPVVVDLASSEDVLKKLAGLLSQADAPPVLLIGEPWQLGKELSAKLGPEMVFAPLPLTAETPALQAAKLLEGFSPAEVGETIIEEVEAQPAVEAAPVESEKNRGDDSVDEMVERLEMLLGDEND